MSAWRPPQTAFSNSRHLVKALNARFNTAMEVIASPPTDHRRRNRGLPSSSRRRDRPNKQQVLRARLIEAGLELFRSKGFANTTVSEIAAAAGTSRRTFFRYFESKDDVVFDWVDEQGDFVTERLALQQRAGVAPLAALHDALIHLARYLDADSARATLLTRIVFDTPDLSRRYQAENSRWEHEVTEFLLSTAGRDAADFFALRVQISAGSAAFVTAMRAWAADNHGKPLLYWVTAAFGALASGLADLS